MFPVLNIGPLAVQTPGLILLAGLWLAISLVEALLKRRPAEETPLNSNQLYGLVFGALLVGIAMARLVYVLRYPGLFRDDPWSLVSTNSGMLDPLGGLAGGLIAGTVYLQRQHLDLRKVLDALTPGLALMGVALGMAHLASGDAYGTPTSLPWAIELWGAARHPAQIYETILALVILWAVLPPQAGRLAPPWAGRLQSESLASLVLFVALTAGARLFLEAFRGDSQLLPNGLRLAQLVAWLVLAGSLVVLGRLLKSKPDLVEA